MVLAGSPGGGRPLAHPEDLVPLGKGTGSSDEGISGKEELSSAQETKLGGLSFIRDSNSSRVNSDDSAHGCARSRSPCKAAKWENPPCHGHWLWKSQLKVCCAHYTHMVRLHRYRCTSC